jgi:amino acid adenylation domain-containing protein
MDGDSLTQRLTNLSPAKRALLELRLNKKQAPAFPERTIPRRASRDSAPLSFAQQRLWFLHQLEPESPGYNQPKAIRLNGSLDVRVLQQALDHIVARHEALRTTFVSVDGIPLQVIAESRAVELPVIDLRQWPDTVRGAEVHRVLVETTRRPFDLSRDLMLRALLLRLADQEHILLLITHHIATDAWSSSVLWQELTALYRSFSSGQPCALPELSVQYADYAAWQRNWLQAEVLETQLSYWKNQLDHIPTLQLPTDRPRLPIQSFRGGRQFLALSNDLAQALKTLSGQENVTLFMTLLAAFQTLLHRYTGQRDIVVGSPIAGRTRPEIEGLIGFFVNTLVLRTNLSGNPSFREVMGQVREVALGAYAHQDLPFEKLVEELQPERNLSSSPLFQVTFALQNVPRQALEVPGLTLSSLQLDSGTAKFDLFLSMHEETEGLRASLEYNTDLFDDATITRMLDHFQTLLKGIVLDPDQRLSDLPLLTEAERRQVLLQCNDTKKDYPKDKCIHELFEEQVEKCPDAVAVIFEEKQLTYRELNRRANQLARYLQKLAVGPEVLVGICMERSLEMLVGVLGVLKAGGAYVPLDPEYPKERLAFMLQDTQAPVLLTQQKLVGESFEDRRWKIDDSDSPFSILDPRFRVVYLDRDWEKIAHESAENPQSEATAGNLVYVTYTSGSTGTPKGVEVLHRGTSRLVLSAEYVRLDANQTLLHLAPTSFDASTFEIWGALLHGGKCVLFPGTVASPNELREVIHKHSISTLWLTASLFNALIDQAPEALSGVRQLLIGGEALSVFHVRQALSLLPGTQIINGYGPTESTTFTCCYSIPRQLDASLTSIPIGPPIANTQVYLLDTHLAPVPIGVAGELHIGGDGLARGYLHRPELTADRFIPNPFSDEPGARLYKTGDVARYLPDGNIEFIGRTDDQVKIRGFRIELGEIEAVLRQHAAVRDAVVIAREEVEKTYHGMSVAERVGDNPQSAFRNPKSTGKRLVAYVVTNQTDRPTIQDLRDFLKRKLPDYMVPSMFVLLENLPLTPNGKLDRKALPEPDQNRSGLEQSFVAPRNLVEETLARVWADLLKVERVGLHDNFFDLGGHSLLGTQVVSRVRSVFQVELSLRSLFEAPTVASLAEHIKSSNT